MSEEINQSPGRIVWHDLRTSDPAKSQAFYSALFGWKVTEHGMGGPEPYRMIQNGKEGIGGFETVEGPSHWIAYANVPDVDAAVEKAQASGGSSPQPGIDMPEVGRFAVIRDPQGASICAFRSVHDDTPEPEQAPVGSFCWDELLTTDADTAKSFYTNVFGYGTAPMDPENPDAYTMFTRPDGRMGVGMMPMPEGAEAPPHWLPYVTVDDVDAMAEKAQSLGATMHKAPDDIPGIGRFAVFADPLGAPFAIYAAAAPSEGADSDDG